MDNRKRHFRKVAVLGAGVMGAQIAALFASADIPVILFDLAGNPENRNAIVLRALEGLLKLNPPPLTLPEKISAIIPANYDDSLPLLKGCDLVIEAISEQLDWKENLYKKITPYISDSALLVTNTSGLSINTLASILPKNLTKRFFGVHFFNPPGYMPLVEMTPNEHTDMAHMVAIETFLVSELGKSIVYARDTPNFIANRIGIFSMLITLYAADKYRIPFDVVDALTGPLIARPKSATLRTADVVGLDTFSHAVTTMRDNLTSDPWHALFETPGWMTSLMQRGALGQKTHQGVYKKEGKNILVYDIDEKSYRSASVKPSKEILEILKISDIAKRFQALKNSQLPEAKFLWTCFREVFHYSAYQLESIASNARDLDQAMRWGFGWQQGPFETWQSAGWAAISQYIQDDISQNKSYANVPLPQWVMDGTQGAYTEAGAWSVEEKMYIPPRKLPVYERQLFPEKVFLQKTPETETLLETDSIRLWRMRDDDLILSFKTKLGVIDPGVIEGIYQSLDLANDNARGLILWTQNSPHFSAGANLKFFAELIRKKQFQAIHDMLNDFQHACLAIRYAQIPVVAAVQGYVLGGGCETMLHAQGISAALRSQIGLVEFGVGLIPAGGGCKEMVRRACASGEESYPKIEKYFKQIAMGLASANAEQAKKMDYLKESDYVVFNSHEILYVAKQQIAAFNAVPYRPSRLKNMTVLGNSGLARLMPQIVNMREGNLISAHDFVIAQHLAKILCGGSIDEKTEVNEEWILKLEREAFIELAQTKESLARIEHMLETGKPLRN